MGFIVSDCPHCGLSEAQMMVRGYFTPPREAQTTDHFVGSVMTTCPRCHNPMSWVLDRPRHNPQHRSNGILTDGGYTAGRAPFKRLAEEQFDDATLGLRRITAWPQSPEPEIPEHTPDIVAKPLLAAERNYPIVGNEEAAGAMYGRALEVALKTKFPHMTGKLYGRIEKLAEEHVITQDLKDWAHNIRDLRNDALHEVAELSRDQLKALRLFTLALMEYLFTMPEHVRLAREETQTLEPQPEAAPEGASA